MDEVQLREEAGICPCELHPDQPCQAHAGQLETPAGALHLALFDAGPASRPGPRILPEEIEPGPVRRIEPVPSEVPIQECDWCGEPRQFRVGICWPCFRDAEAAGQLCTHEPDRIEFPGGYAVLPTCSISANPSWSAYMDGEVRPIRKCPACLTQLWGRRIERGVVLR